MQWASSTTSSPVVPASCGSTPSRNPGLLSRSGLTSRTSTAPDCTSAYTCAPLVDVAGVDRDRARAGGGRGGDLVAHQGEQRADDDRRAGAPGPQQRGRDEVDGGLAPAGALHDQGPPAPGHQGLDRGPLVLAEAGGGAGQRAQRVLGLVAGRRGEEVGHAPTVPDASPGTPARGAAVERRARCGRPAGSPRQGSGSGTVSPRATGRTPVRPRRWTSARKSDSGLRNTP